MTADQVPEGLGRSHDSWLSAVNRSDAAGYADLVTEDVVWLPPGQRVIEGRDAFRRWLAPFLDEYGYRFTVTNSRFRVAEGWALEEASFQSHMTPHAGGDALEHQGRFVILWRQDDDTEWRIERYVDTTDFDDPPH